MDSQSESIKSYESKHTIYSLNVKDAVGMFGIKYRVHRTGFFQWYGVRTYGAGLNDGYIRLFGAKKTPERLTKLERYAACVEQIVGKKEMEQLYSMCDLYGVAKLLSGNSSSSETFSFLRNMDTLNDLLVERKSFGLSSRKTTKFETCCEEIESFLLEQYITVVNKKISTENVGFGNLYPGCVKFSVLLTPGNPEKTIAVIRERVNNKVLNYK